MNDVSAGRVKRRVTWLGTLTALSLVACGSSARVSTPSHHQLTGRVLTETVGGGYVPGDVAFAEQLPVVTVLANGRTFTVDEASSVSIASRAALVRVAERTLPRNTLDQIVNLAEAAGITPQPPEFGHPSVTDLPTTTVTVTVDGRTSTAAVYALGFKEGLTTDQLAARRRLQAFVNTLARLVGKAGPGSRPRPYVPRSLSVYASALAIPPTKPSRPRRWPLRSFSPIAPGSVECVPVTGAPAVREALSLMAAATRDTVWLSSGRRWQVAARPDLPGTRSCT